MSVVRLCSLNEWNGVVLTLDEQQVRLYWCVREFEDVILFLLVCDRKLTLMWFPNTLQWWWNDDCAFMFVKCMERWRVGPGRTESTLRLYCVLEFEVVICVRSARGRNLILIWWYPNTLQWRWRPCVNVRWTCWTASCWPYTNRQCVRIGVWLNLKLLFVLVSISGRNLTLVRFKCTSTATGLRLCSNVWNGVALALDAQKVRLCVCVCVCVCAWTWRCYLCSM